MPEITFSCLLEYIRAWSSSGWLRAGWGLTWSRHWLVKILSQRPFDFTYTSSLMLKGYTYSQRESMSSMQREPFLSHRRKKTDFPPEPAGYHSTQNQNLNAELIRVSGTLVYSWWVCGALWSPNPRDIKRQTKGWSSGLPAAENREVYSPLGTSLLEGQRICSVLCKKLVLRQQLSLFLHDCPWCCLFLSHSWGRGHFTGALHCSGSLLQQTNFFGLIQPLQMN